MNLMEKMMFTVYQSSLGFEETIEALKKAAPQNGWTIPMVHDLQKEYREAGHEDMSKVTVLYFCNPDGGYAILQDDAHKPMSVMMPMGVSVYETRDGQVHVAGMNLGKMSMAFGGTVKAVLQEGASNFKNSLEGIAEPVAEPDVPVKKGHCLLGCVSLTAIVGGLLAGLIVLASKILPKLMIKMMQTRMPKMMARMEEAGVQPPCAQIILEHMESEEA